MNLTDSSEKITPLEALRAACDELRAKGKKIIHCHGVFDLLHIGHIKHFEAARKLGDVLVVTLTPDRFVNKGPGRPAFTEQLRAQSVAALAAVDLVAINSSAGATSALEITKPYRYAKGSDYRDRAATSGSRLQGEIDLVRSFGGDIAFTDEPQFSSSTLINEFLSPYSLQVREQLAALRSRSSSRDIQQLFALLDKATGSVEVPDTVSAVFKALFPALDVRSVPTTNNDTPHYGSFKNIEATITTGVAEIRVNQHAMTDKEARLPVLSTTPIDPSALLAAAKVLDLVGVTEPSIATLFLCVFAQECKPGVTLAALRKVMESISK